MITLGTVKFSGLSGEKYLFTAYPLETIFDTPLNGVFIVTRRGHGTSKTGFAHRRILTGQSDEFRQRLHSEKQALCAKGANCICVHAEPDKDASLRIEQDLLAKPPEGTT